MGRGLDDACAEDQAAISHRSDLVARSKPDRASPRLGCTTEPAIPVALDSSPRQFVETADGRIDPAIGVAL
jgi:hypothetical protein